MGGDQHPGHAWIALALLLLACCPSTESRQLPMAAAASRRQLLQEINTANFTGMCGTLIPTDREAALVFNMLFGRVAPAERVTVPVVVHVIEPEQASEAWSSRYYDPVDSAMVEATIALLNRIFAGNTSTSSTQPETPAATPFSFRLARAGNSSRAFLSVTDSDWFSAPLTPAVLRDPTSLENVRRASHHVGSAATLNVYVRSLKASGVFGAATFPHYLEPGSDELQPFSTYAVSHDGITIDGATLLGAKDRGAPLGVGTFARNTATLAHHVGEWLGLFHTYQGVSLNASASNATNSSVCSLQQELFILSPKTGPGDGCGDTPPHLPPKPRPSGCLSSSNTSAGPDTCTNFQGSDPQTNLLNAVDHNAECGTTLTAGQASRMAKAWATWRQPGVFAAAVIPELLRVNLTAANTSVQLPVFDGVAAPACGSSLPLLFSQQSAPTRGALSVTTVASNLSSTVTVVTYTPNEGQAADGLGDEFTYVITDPCAGDSNVGSLQVLFPLLPASGANLTGNDTLTNGTSNATADSTLAAVDDFWSKQAGSTYNLNVLENDAVDGIQGVTIINVTQPTGAGGNTSIMALASGTAKVHFIAPTATGNSTFSYTISGTSNATGAVLTSTASVTVRLTRRATCPSLGHLGCVSGAGKLLTPGAKCPAGMHCVRSSKAGTRCAYALQPAGFVCNRASLCGPCGGIATCDGTSAACPPFDLAAARAAGPIAKIVVKKVAGAAGTAAYMCSLGSGVAPSALSAPTGSGFDEDWLRINLEKPAPDGSTWEWFVRGCNSNSTASGCDTSKAQEQCRVGHFFVWRGTQAEHCSNEGAERVVELACVYDTASNACWWGCQQSLNASSSGSG